jgi:type II pantothenate kinase
MTANPTMDVGLDLGATLVKCVVVPANDGLDSFETALFPAADAAGLASFLSRRTLRRLAVTGAGARGFIETTGHLLPSIAVDQVGEFAAWHAGERTLLRQADFVPTEPHLLVSVGTGTSILAVEKNGVTRLGGTALGGGTLHGLGQLLVGESDHDRLAQLASEGARTGVDLLVSDLYRQGEIALDADLTAANFGRVDSPARSALAQSVTRLVAENVGLLAGALATRLAATASPRPASERLDVVYAGSTLARHEKLRDILTFATDLAGARARFLPHGEFVGAIGALAASGV